MFDGFYKSAFKVDDRVGRSVTFVRAGRLLGGNSAFAHVGGYTEQDGEIRLDLTSRRHLDDPAHQSLLGSDVSQVSIAGRAVGNAFHFSGSSPQMPGAIIQSVVTPLDDGEMPPPGMVGEGGIGNGLYSIHFKMLDGLDGGLTGVVLLNDGQILGGDAYFYYLGSYSSSAGRWKGEILSQEHTPARKEHPLFGGLDVGIGFSGTCSPDGAELEGVALAGKRSVRLQAKLRLIDRG
ncbi:hypothetical protein BH11PSE4_BH11PSE4_24660 [soil metagenome]